MGAIFHSILFYKITCNGEIKKGFAPYRGASMEDDVLKAFIGLNFVGRGVPISVEVKTIREFPGEENWFDHVYYMDNFKYLYTAHSFAGEIVHRRNMQKFFN